MALKRIEQLDGAQAERLTELFQAEWWTRGRTLEETNVMLASGNLLFGLADEESGQLVAFARVLTDNVFKALIFDVIVDPGYRGQKLGALLMDWIKSRPELARVRHFELYCLPELVPFYERWGLTTDVGDINLMRGATR